MCLYVPGRVLIIYSSTVLSQGRRDLKDWDVIWWRAMKGRRVFCMHGAWLGPQSTRLNACPPDACSLISTEIQRGRVGGPGHSAITLSKCCSALAASQCHLTQEQTAETNISKFLLFSSNFHSFPLLTSTKLMLCIYTQSSGLWILVYFLLNFSEILEYSER